MRKSCLLLIVIFNLVRLDMPLPSIRYLDPDTLFDKLTCKVSDRVVDRISKSCDSAGGILGADKGADSAVLAIESNNICLDRTVGHVFRRINRQFSVKWY